MRSRGVLLGTLATVVGLVARVALPELLRHFFVPIQRWYFHRYIESFDPDPPFLPLGWVPEIVFPLLGSLVAGALAAIVFRKKSLVLSVTVGTLVLCEFLVWWRKAFPWDWEFDALALLSGVLAFLACHLTQRFLAKRAHAVDARH